MEKKIKNTKSFVFFYQLHLKPGTSPHSIMVKVMDCDLKVIELKLHLYYYIHFQTNTPGKDMNPLILLDYEFNGITATRMALALNNPQRLICH